MASDSFLHRWNKRKQAIADDESRELNADVALGDHEVVSDTAALSETTSPSETANGVATDTQEIEDTDQDVPISPPDMEDVARLKQGDSAASFLVKGVSAEIKKAALRKLFHSDAYNVLDGMNDYDLDYSNKASLSAEVAASLRKWTKEQVDDLQEEESTQSDTDRIDEERLEGTVENDDQKEGEQESTVHKRTSNASLESETNSTHEVDRDKLSDSAGQNVPIKNMDNNSDGS